MRNKKVKLIYGIVVIMILIITLAGCSSEERSANDERLSDDLADVGDPENNGLDETGIQKVILNLWDFSSLDSDAVIEGFQLNVARGKLEVSDRWSNEGTNSLKLTATERASEGVMHASIMNVDVSGLPVGTKHECSVTLYVPSGSGFIGSFIRLGRAYYGGENDSSEVYITEEVIVLKEGEQILKAVTDGIDYSDRTDFRFIFFWEMIPDAPSGSEVYADQIIIKTQ